MSELAPTPFDTAAETRRGPRDCWEKSDDALRDDVCEALAADAALDARDMNVGVDDGEVVLSGVAADVDAREHAARVALAVAGVRAVHNFVGIKLSS